LPPIQTSFVFGDQFGYGLLSMQIVFTLSYNLISSRCAVTRVVHAALAVMCVVLAPPVVAAVSGYAFTANAHDYSVSTYRIDAATGRLRHQGHTPVPKLPSAVEVHPSGKFVYVVSKTPDRITGFHLDAASGMLTPVPGSPFPSEAHSPFALTFHPSGKFAYVAARFAGVGAYRVDEKTGALTSLPGSPFKAQERTRSVVVHPGGQFLYVINGYSNSVSAYRIDQLTGVLSEIEGSPFSVGNDVGVIDYRALKMEDVPEKAGGIPYHMAMDPKGRFAMVVNWAAANVSVFRINAVNGKLTPVEGSPFFSGFNPHNVSMHPSGKFVFVAQWSSSEIMVHALDAVTGRLSPVPGAPFPSGGVGPVAVKFNGDGSQAYVTHFESNDVALFDIDESHGAMQLREVIKTRDAPWSLALAPGKADKAPLPIRLALSAQGQTGIELLELASHKVVAHAFTKSDAIALTRDGRFAYVLDNKSATMSVLSVDPVKGKLDAVPGSVIATGASPSDLMVDRNGWYAYVSNADDDTLSIYFLDKETGTPSPVRGSPVRTGKRPVAVTLDPAMRYAYVANADSNDVSVFRHFSGVAPLVLAGTKWGSPFAAGKEPVDVEVEPTGRFAYVANAGSNNISAYRIHHHTGALAELPGSPFAAGERPVALLAHPNGKWMYVALQNAQQILIYEIETELGALKKIQQPVRLSLAPKALRMDEKTGTVYVVSTDGRWLGFLVDGDSGALQLNNENKQRQLLNDLAIIP
jgi:6-phosphogluconolactonase (cycloisomerase 2 family)